jgi:hypothetical protein
MRFRPFQSLSLPTKVPVIKLALAAVWLLLLQFCYFYSARDPGSFFFDAERAYKPHLSNLREAEAEKFIQQAVNTPATATSPQAQEINHHVSEHTQNASRICVGIPTKGREKEQFLPRTLASLVDTLSPLERTYLHLIVLITEDDPTQNPAYGQSWLTNIADEVLLYTPAPKHLQEETYRHIGDHIPGRKAGRNEHVKFDYATLMEACNEREMDHFLLVEDDIITVPDWFQRLILALDLVEATNQPNDWLYLRLFYTELYHGWNSEEWPMYIRRLLIVYAATAFGTWVATRVWARVFQGRLPGLWHCVLSFHFFFIAFTTLFFMAGRVSVSHHQEGVREMNKFGCCAQGLAFPKRHLVWLTQKLRDPPHGIPGDSFIEVMADEKGLQRWAMEPSVFQHVGVRGSSAKGGESRLEWNFGFETSSYIDQRG